MNGKTHTHGTKTVFAASDSKLINTIIKEKEIELKITESFYGVNKITEEELIKGIKENNSINLIGEKVISIALKNNLITKKGIKTIKGIPHIQVYKL